MKTEFVPDHQAGVLVIGDVILDRYLYGETTRISPEAPVPVVLVRNTEERPGGAGNVALNISRLEIKVSLIGLTGDDPAAGTLETILSNAGVRCKFSRQSGFPTITKLRVLSQHQQLIRLDYEAHPEVAATDALLDDFNAQIATADVVVLSDYAKGSLKDIRTFISTCRARGKRVLIDPKGDAFDRYQGADLLTPNLKEFETVMGACDGVPDMVEKGRTLCARLNLGALLITRGEQGMTLIHPGAGALHLPAEAREVFDVTGAGDTVIATLAAALASGYEYESAAEFANRAAGLVVAKLGTASVTVAELNGATSAAHPVAAPAVLSETGLIDAVKTLRARGGRVVMTNGCFDILHAGHVLYLQQARQMGDYLIVAINDDDSVRRLKGNSRPVNKLAHRMEVLHALRSVDWVIPFTEDTPERLITAIMPDILVKGGDYQQDQIAGAKAVLAQGGRVEIIPLFEDCSSSRILHAASAGEADR